jgi:2-methylisoborneol synthase
MTHGLPPPGPTGLGTTAAALAEHSRPARAVAALYCPTAVRDDPALARQVQDRLDTWAPGVDLAPDAVAGYGRLAVLTHPDTDDPARLAVAGQLLAVGALLENSAGSAPSMTAATATTAPTTTAAAAATTASMLAQALDAALQEVFDACDTPRLPRRADITAPAAAADITPDIADQPALRSTLAAVSALPCSPYQVDRIRRECQALAAAAPTRTGPHPPWDHLALAHLNAYSPALTALDAVDGYELTPTAAAHPDLRRVQRLAALAAALLRDLAHPAPSGLTASIARADGLGTPAAARRAATVHDDAMHAFQHHATALAGGADPDTRRYLSGLWTWLGGHRTNTAQILDEG